MDKLPIELLSRIMVFVVCTTDNEPEECCPDHFSDNSRDYADFWLPISRTSPQTFGPLQLGTVCRFWRSVSENTPSLWNKFAVCIDSMNDSNISKTMCQLSGWLSRSRASPLDILVINHGVDSAKHDVSSRNTIKVLDELHIHSERFLSVALHLSANFWAPLQYWSKPSPQLTHFQLVHEDYTLGLQNHDVKAFWPSLTHLNLKSVHLGNISIITTSLICMQLDGVRIPLPWRAIEHAHRLTHLVLRHCSPVHRNTSVINQSSITLHSVRRFEYQPGSHSDEVDFMGMFIFPALEVFTLEDEAYVRGYIIDVLELHPFLPTCASSLRRITLIETEGDHRPPPDCGILVNILSALPSLEYLELGLINVAYSYFTPLLSRLADTRGASDITFLPRLQSLKFNSLHGIFWPLIPSIFQRTSGPLDQRPLRQLVIEDVLAVKAEFLTVDIIDQLIVLLDDGVDIQLYDEEGEWITLRESARW